AACFRGVDRRQPRPAGRAGAHAVGRMGRRHAAASLDVDRGDPRLLSGVHLDQERAAVPRARARRARRPSGGEIRPRLDWGRLAAMALIAVVLWRRRIDESDDARPAYAFAIALGLLSNPHLFMHDTVIWTVPLLLCAASMRDAGAAWAPFAIFALAWPAIFLVA